MVTGGFPLAILIKLFTVPSRLTACCTTCARSTTCWHGVSY